jgi:hypothetical protein
MSRTRAGPPRELAETAEAVPPPLLANLTALMAALDPDAVPSTLAACRKVANDGLRYDDATDFVRALCSELQTYADEPEVTAEALAELKRHERGTMH